MVRVVYRTSKFDYVPGNLVDVLIHQEEITHFYRPSERRWINVRLDPIRGNRSRYRGPERRRTDHKPEVEKQEAENGLMNAEGDDTDWLEDLWGHIEN